MKKWVQVILFVLIVSVGLLMIDNLLFGIMGETCTCQNDAAARMECQYVCMSYGGCDDIWVQHPGYCQENICCRRVWNWCVGNVTQPIFGYHCDGCLDCNIWT